MPHLSELLLVFVTYFVATASPGPSNMAIMGTAMRSGRRAALALAGGVIVSSMTWALLAAGGILSFMATFAELLIVLKIAGGLYLLWLAWKAGQSALRPAQRTDTVSPPVVRYGKLFRQGVLMHILNPKAILTWVSIMSVTLTPGADAGVLPDVIGGCAAICIVVFSSYALLFSTPMMVALYQRVQRTLDAVLAVCFALAGVRLLLSRS